MENKKVYYQIRITKENGNHVVMYENQDCSLTMSMFGWYEAHQEFFNGTLSVEEERR